MRRKLLGRFGLDGNKTVASLSPSGEIAGLLVQDYVNGESRIIKFGFGEIEITNDGSEISVFLTVYD